MRVGSSEVTLKNVYFMAKNNVRLLGSPTTGSSTRQITAHARHTADIKAHLGYSNVDYDPQDLLAQISGVDYSSLDDAGKSQYLDMLNVLKTIDQRQYERWLTQEDRQYNSIQSQLGRLMSTGMSRDAALAMLSNGTTQIQNTASPFGGDSSMFPSQTALNENQVTTNNIGSALSIVNTVMELAKFGIGLPSLLSSNEISRNAAYVSGQQTKAYQALGTISDLAGAAIQGGKLATDNLKDRDSFIAGMDGLYSANPQYQGAMAALRSNPFGMQTLDSYVNQNFATKQVRPTSDMVDKATKAALAEYYASELNVDQLRASLDVTRAELNRINQEIEQSDMTFPYTLNDLLQGNIRNDLQNEQLSQQIEQSSQLFPVQLRTAEAQLTSVEQENSIRSWTVKNFELNGDDYNTAAALELSIKINAMNAANTDDAKMAAFESIINSKQASRCLSYVNLLSAQGASDFLTQHPELQTMIGMVENTDWMTIYNTWLQTKGIKGTLNRIPEDILTQFKRVAEIAGSSGKNPYNLLWDGITAM